MSGALAVVAASLDSTGMLKWLGLVLSPGSLKVSFFPPDFSFWPLSVMGSFQKNSWTNDMEDQGFQKYKSRHCQAFLIFKLGVIRSPFLKYSID